MRRSHALVLAAALNAAPAAAQAPATAFARSVALMDQLAETCPPFYAVDHQGLAAHRSFFEEAAVRAWGEAAFTAALQSQRSALQQEISDKGARAWCLAERSGLTGIGMQALFPAETLLA